MPLNLEKALQKAKRERDQGNVNHISSVGTPTPAPTPITFSNAPNYRDVRRVQLNKAVIAQNHCVCALADVPESNFYRVLRVQLQQLAEEKSWRTIMVTSTLPNEGKTLTCINLSFSFAKAYDQTVLLVDADLRKQQVHKALGIESQYGMVDFIIERQPIRDCMIWPENEKLVIISGGKTIDDSSELLSSRVMKDFVRQVRDRYEDRLVFFDAPPIMASPDALAFAPLVDGIVVVVRAGQTSLKQLRKAVEMLPKDKLAGFVVNGQKCHHGNYYYYGK